jgi:Carboxypeptidase regulatory-like domain
MKLQALFTRMLRTSLAIAVGAMLFIPRPLLAQVDTGSILGTITDPSGAVIGGATVTLTNEGTSATLSTTVESDGSYKFTPVRIGSYKVTASSQGFQTTEQKNIVVNVGSSVLVNFALRPGAVTETVEVTTSTPVLETQDASVGQVVNSRNVNNLPLNGRNFTFLAQLSAGVNSPQADTRGNAASGAFSANGSRPAQNNYLLDGIDNNSDTVDFLNGTNFVVLPPVDAIQEFKVQTTNFSAEYGRSGAAVLNATIKSGTNAWHGAGWEFFRNDKLDAADYFERVGNATKKGELRLNQFGVAIGGPVIKNKVFIFGDYEGLRRRQGAPHTGSVPTNLERSSGYTDFTELLQSTTQTDALNRTMPFGTILDPATTRQISPGVFVRDPFGTCPASTVTFTAAACNLNILPAGRLDANAIKLLNLYPTPNAGGISSNYIVSPAISENRNAFDTRMDLNLSDKNQIFYRFSYVDDPQFIPGIFGGVADGGGFQEGPQTALAQQSALAWTHVFSPSLVNVARAGLNYLHTTRVSPAANDLSDLPGQYGIAGIPQEHENGGLPAFGIQGLQTLGSNAFLPSDEVSSTFQITDDLTKIYGKHTFKMGFEFQHVKFSTLQPPWSRGQFNFDGVYTNIPGASPSSNNTGIAQLLLTPIASTVGGPDYVGGPGAQGQGTAAFVSNISLTDNGKNYYGSYINDDWKVTPKLTVNLGLRWDFFGLVFEHHGAQANFVPGGPPTGSPLFLFPEGTNAASFSSGCPTCFTDLLAKDGITPVIGNKYGKGLGESQKTNFAPRVGFAYQVTPKLVARGGFGLFYNGFENRGFSPNLGENYPFQFNFSYTSPSDNTPITYAGCTSPDATPIGSATLETGFSCTPLDPTLVNASGLALRGIQFKYQTPYSMGGNFTVQYQLTPSMSVQAGYVTSLARHLEVFPNSNNVTSIVDTNGDTGLHVPFPDFGHGSSYATTNGNSWYHSLQTKVEKQFANGLNFLATYTFSKTETDAGDLLNGGSLGGFRAPDVPGAGIHFDYGLASFDIRNVFHFSGGYELPFGKGKRYMASSSGIGNTLASGWSVNWSATVQGGQPITLSCPSGTANGTGCYDLLVKGQSPKLGLHTNANGELSWIGNPAAFSQPCKLVSGAPDPTSVPGCSPLTGLGVLGGPRSTIEGPPFRRLDFSVFKDFQLTERFKLQFRSEFFNILNHPNFNAPGFGGNGVVAIGGATNYTSSHFGAIGSTRDAPYDPRQIQFALKLYF